MSTTATPGFSRNAAENPWPHAGSMSVAQYAAFPALLLVIAVLFNAVLAVVNGNVLPLTPTAVIAIEVAIVGSANAWALLHYRPEMNPWYALAAFAAAFALLRSAVLGSVELKYFRDLMLVPTFVLLGMACAQRRMIQAVIILLGIVVAGIVLEAVIPDGYAAMFDIKHFYIATRGMSAGDFTNEASELYVSATRPEARFLPFFDLHRLSSVFLEPVSLGNFAMTITAFSAAFWKHLTAKAKVFLILSIVLMLFACDGRLAMAASLLILVAAPLMRLLPAQTPVLFLPLVTVTAIGTAILFESDSQGDNLPGRIAHTVRLLADLRIEDWFGLSDRLLAVAVDSGLVYLIITQSILGLMLFWLVIALSLRQGEDAQKIYKGGICLALTLIMMVSYSSIGIKTAAPLWFIYGTLYGPLVSAVPQSLKRRQGAR